MHEENWSHGVYVILLWLSALGCCWLALRVVRLDKSAAARNFTRVVVLAAAWSGSSLFSAIVGSESLATFFLLSRYAVIGFVAPFFLAFTLAYTDEKWAPSWKRLAPVLVVPTITPIVLVVSPASFLSEPTYVRTGGYFLIEAYREGPWFWVHAGHSYLLFLASYVLLFHAMFRVRSYHTSQFALLVFGTSIPLVANVVTRADLVGYGLPHLDWAATAFTVVCLAWYVAVFRFRLLEVMPVARDRIVAMLADPVVVLDAEDRVVDANPAARKILGVNLSHLLGEHFDDVWPDGLAAQWNLRMQQSPDPGEVKILTSRGARSYEVRVSDVSGGRGRALGRVVVLHDMTERIRMIGELDAYARTVAHDLRNPLGASLGYLDLAAARIDDSPQDAARFVASARQACGESLAIVDGLSRLATVREASVFMTAVDMRTVVGDVLERFGAEIGEVDATVHLPSEWPDTKGDPALLGEVWANLLSNALKYGGSPPVIEIGVEVEGASPGGEIRYWVEDNGGGLDEGQRASLFREFVRLAPERAEGHGLGLSIVRRIIERLGGAVGVEPATSGGCRFWFTLPRL